MKRLIALAASRLLAGRSPIKTTRRFAVASLLVIALAVVLGAPAPASAGKVLGTQFTLKLYPTADSPSPKATGTLTLHSSTPPVYDMVIVSVSKLAPNASYYMPVVYRYRDYWGGWHDQVYNVPIPTDARGNGQDGFGRSGWLILPYEFQVYDSSGTLVLTPHP
jgi:hypothetical protein